jgi:uncharacterized protein
MNSTTVLILLVVFTATFIRSTFGFGEALVAVPLLALLIPIPLAAPIAVLLSITVAAVIVAQDWRHIHFRSAMGLLLPTLLGTPLGVLLLKTSHPAVVKTALAVLIILFFSYTFAGLSLPELHHDNRAWLSICGLLAGVLGGAYGMNGPPLVIYGAMRRWSPQHLRATLQGYFLPASILVMAGYGFSGLWTPAVTHLYLLSLPAALPGVVLGRIANRRLKGELFLRVVSAGLILAGLVLLFQTFHSK